MHKVTLDKHLDRAHSTQPDSEPSFKCDICEDASFASATDLSEHQQLVHASRVDNCESSNRDDDNGSDVELDDLLIVRERMDTSG